jgi:cation:H+ antiporter
VVAFGTSSPELAISVQSAFAGQPEIAVGNVVGSNILNVLLILGLAALIAPLGVAQKLIRVDVPLMIGASLLLILMARDGTVSRLDGILLSAGAVAYTAFCVIQSRNESRAVRDEYEEEFAPPAGEAAGGVRRQALNFVLMGVGLGLLMVGSRWMVDGATLFARRVGVSELIIGLTVIAVGTSLPEIATTVMASIRGERDIAVGNVIGSNLFNILLVLGATAVVAPRGVPVPPAALAFDLPVMVAVMIACLPVFFIGGTISRWEGVLFLGYYAAYTARLVLDATGSDHARTFDGAMLYFAFPLTAVTLLVLVGRTFRQNRREPDVSESTPSVEQP